MQPRAPARSDPIPTTYGHHMWYCICGHDFSPSQATLSLFHRRFGQRAAPPRSAASSMVVLSHALRRSPDPLPEDPGCSSLRNPFGGPEHFLQLCPGIFAALFFSMSNAKNSVDVQPPMMAPAMFSLLCKSPWTRLLLCFSF
uniref:Uncharacterized protein n=1 Tax=Triticum urartu TaxID=4572 RepID=A0A8R7PSG4_TRIUA